jgi:hypothetical protein
MHGLVLTLGMLLSQLTTENFNKVEVGAHIQQVEELLGPASSVHYESGDELCLLWEGDDAVATVTFKKERVVSKWQVGL